MEKDIVKAFYEMMDAIGAYIHNSAVENEIYKKHTDRKETPFYQTADEYADMAREQFILEKETGITSIVCERIPRREKLGRCL